MSTNATELVDVRLVAFPLDVFRRAREHHDELMREFALLAVAEESDSSAAVPRQLVELVEGLRSRYARITAGPDARRDEALQRGEDSVDLVYQVPPEVREAVLNLARMLEEADEFCRQGQHLLTLAAPPEAVEFRNWYLGEFLAQLDGIPPTPWPERGRARPPTPR